MREKTWTNLAFLALLFGMAVSIYLTIHHYDLAFGLRDTKSFCSVSDTVDCDAVNASAYSEILGVPVALLGFFAYAVQLLLLLGFRALEESAKPRLARYFLYMGALDLLMSLYLGLASAFILHLVCLFCLSLYGVSFVVFFAGWKIVRPPRFTNLADDLKALFRSENGARGTLALVLAIPLGAALAHGIYKQNVAGEMDHLVEMSIGEWLSTPKFDFHIQGAPEVGNPQAPFVLVEFSDFECPHCKRAAPSLHAFVSAHKNDVRFVFQSYPLDGACNPNMEGGGGHKNSCLLAKASLCAKRQDKFWPAHDWIFAHQEGISANSVDDMVKELSLDQNTFTTCMASAEVTAELSGQIERGNLSGVKGTPAVFANGKMLPGGFLIPVLEAALKKSKSQ